MPRNDMLLMVASRESTCSDAHVAIETRRDGKEREFVRAREKYSRCGREKGDENEARPYFRVTVALPSVSRHRLYATRCIPLLLPSVCMCVHIYIYMCVCARCIGRIYIWPEGGAGLALVLARASVLHVCVHARLCMWWEGQWFRRFHYSALRAELT